MNGLCTEINTIFDEVLFVGPDLKGKGGISSVLQSYSTFVKPFHFTQVNSTHGTMAGLFTLARTMLYIPFARLFGRKIMHIHFCGGKSWRRERKVARWGKFWGYRVVMHSHEGNFKKFIRDEGVENIRHTLLRFDCIVSLSRKWVALYKELLNIDDICYINNIVLPPLHTKDYSQEKSTLTFVFLGEIGERKGLYDLVRATALLDNDLSWRLIIGGNGDTDKLTSLIDESGRNSNIDFKGWVSGTAKDELMAQADVLVLPSFTEGLPISVLEAMSAGLGIITTDVGSISDVVTDNENGLFVIPGDVQSIAQAMKRYIDDHKLVSKHAAVSAERIKAYYPDAVRQSLINLYEDILGGK